MQSLKGSIRMILLIAAWFFTGTGVPGVSSVPASTPAPGPSEGPVSPDSLPGQEAPEILILGTPHLSQAERSFPPAATDSVVEALERYRPDMVAVEYLPASWPEGKGRDYRPGFDLTEYARRWDAPDAGSATLSDSARAADSRCRGARFYFLQRDLVNAAYRWTAADCSAERDSAIGAFLSDIGEHEMVRIAFPVARSAGVERVVSFDYQGEDARWFISPGYLKSLAGEGGPGVEAQVDSLTAEMEAFRAREAEFEENHGLTEILRRRNSGFWLDEQERVYEEVLPRLSHRDAGRRQTENYWLRNREMFANIRAAADQRGDVERILVVVGAGHKYFLDELAREAGWEWIDPLGYLPPASSGS